MELVTYCDRDAKQLTYMNKPTLSNEIRLKKLVREPPQKVDHDFPEKVIVKWIPRNELTGKGRDRVAGLEVGYPGQKTNSPMGWQCHMWFVTR